MGYTPVMPAQRRLRQEDSEFEAILGYMRPCFKKKKEKFACIGVPRLQREEINFSSSPL
jgi:hypothetical protein